MSDNKTMEHHHVDTMTHELRIDGHHLIEKKQKTLTHIDGIDKTLILVHFRSIDDKSYQVTETNYCGVPESQVETDMAEEEVKKFEEDWTNLWYPKMESSVSGFERNVQNEIKNLHQ